MGANANMLAPILIKNNTMHPLIDIIETTEEDNILPQIINNIMRQIYHLHVLATDEHKYYGSLKAIFDDKNDVGVSKFTLDRYKWDKPFSNEKVVIRKGVMKTTNDVKQ
jgi:hypothetical protein